MRRPPPTRSIAIALLTLLLAACASSQTPTAPNASSTPSAPATAPVSSAAVASPPSSDACAGADLVITSTGWGGAAGSRGADVRVENTADRACSVSGPAVAIVDGSGAVQIEGDAGTGGGDVVLDPGTATTFSLLFSNWCDAATPLPLRVVVKVGSDVVPIEGLPLETADELPPCNGEDQPASLSTIPWSGG